MIAQFEYSHTVAPEDMDDLGHANNFHYIKWLQHAAVAHSAAVGWTQQRYDELGAGWVVRSHKIEYLKPAFKGDRLTIRTWVANMKPATSLRMYEIFNEQGQILAQAETDWAFINYVRQKPVRVPKEVKRCFTVVVTPEK